MSRERRTRRLPTLAKRYLRAGKRRLTLRAIVDRHMMVAAMFPGRNSDARARKFLALVIAEDRARVVIQKNFDRILATPGALPQPEETPV